MLTSIYMYHASSSKLSCMCLGTCLTMNVNTIDVTVISILGIHFKFSEMKSEKLRGFFGGAFSTVILTVPNKQIDDFTFQTLTQKICLVVRYKSSKDKHMFLSTVSHILLDELSSSMGRKGLKKLLLTSLLQCRTGWENIFLYTLLPL